jgi:hypothetical protein
MATRALYLLIMGGTFVVAWMVTSRW